MKVPVWVALYIAYLYVVIFIRTLQLHCKVRLLSWYVVSLSVVCLSFTRVYYDKTTEARITRFSLKSSAMSQLWQWNSIGDPLDWGLRLGWGSLVLDFLRGVISQKWCKMEPIGHSLIGNHNILAWLSSGRTSDLRSRFRFRAMTVTLPAGYFSDRWLVFRGM